MIDLAPSAERHLRDFLEYYADNHRPRAIRNFAHALAEASLIISNAPERGLLAPRPYPELSRLGLRWLKRGRYWIAYSEESLTIIGIFFDTADIPGQLR